ncbi:MAG: PAS domain-containing protein, partial [Solirubrobacteraceae bacterium]
MTPPQSSTQHASALAAVVSGLRTNPVARHAFDEPSRFRAVVDLHGVIVDVNPYRAAGAAVPREAMVGQPLWRMGVYAVDPGWEARWRTRLEESLNGVGTVEYEDEFPTDEHGPFGVRGELSVVRDDDGAAIGFYLEVTNVDIVRETKQELKREIALRQLIFDQTFQLTAILGPDGTVLDVNKAVERIGIPREAFIGRHLYDLGVDEPNGEARAREWKRRIEHLQDATEPFRAFDLLHADDGKLLRAVDCSMTPVRSEEGRLEMILLELRDQT